MKLIYFNIQKYPQSANNLSIMQYIKNLYWENEYNWFISKLHQISNFEVKITEISEFEFVTVIASFDLVVGGGEVPHQTLPRY